MSFRKRNIGISGPSNSRVPSSSAAEGALPPAAAASRPTAPAPAPIPGLRPSPLDGRPTTSTGTQSLDSLLAGHSGFALGNSILVGESGNTDYAGTLLRFYAAEGVVQGHRVHVVGVGEYWGRDLPGLVGAAVEKEERKKESGAEKEKMKIAWRYERLGEFGESSRALPVPQRGPAAKSSVGSQLEATPQAFCHAFDLTKRLALPSPTAIDYILLRPASSTSSPFVSVIQTLSQELSSALPTTIHRLVIPTLLSPAFYPPSASSPQQVLQFMHSLRALLRLYPTRLTAMISLPLSLYPRETGLTRWMELLSDGVLELTPFPHAVDAGPPLAASGAATAAEEKPQGMVKIHRLPVFHERGGGGAGVGDDLAFTVSRRRFVIKPFSLPPVEGDTEAQRGEGEGKPTKVDIDF